MHPFRVYDKQKKLTWVVLNYHSATDSYLVARQDDSNLDGEIAQISSEHLQGLRFVDFTEEGE